MATIVRTQRYPNPSARHQVTALLSRLLPVHSVRESSASSAPTRHLDGVRVHRTLDDVRHEQLRDLPPRGLVL